MFRPHTEHMKISLFDAVNQMPRPMRIRLESSWAVVFYKEIFSNIDEHLFSVLYSENYSRPNTPVNILVCAELLKAHFRWTDDELFDQCMFNLQIRYALGDRAFEGELFSERTLYYFRKALARHMQKTGENLLEKIFEKLTEKQLEKFSIKSKTQRMDSSYISSNIRTYTRIQLLVEVIQRFCRALSEYDRNKYQDRFDNYIKKSSGQYQYHLSNDNISKTLDRIGRLLFWILETFSGSYGETIAYQLVNRVTEEHFILEGETIHPKGSEELSASSLQSPDDMEATYRRKGNENHRGYVINVSETCEEGNKAQIITDVSVSSNTTDDTEIFGDRIPKIVEKTSLKTIATDGGYGSQDNDQLCEALEIEHVQSGIKGRKPFEDKLHLSDFEFTTMEDSQRECIRCPNGILVEVKEGRKSESRIAVFSKGECSNCPYSNHCCTIERKSGRVLYYRIYEQRRVERFKRSSDFFNNGKNPRSAIEGTIKQFKHKLPYRKLPVRGFCRVVQYVFSTAIMINFSRVLAICEQNTVVFHSFFDHLHIFIQLFHNYLQKLLQMMYSLKNSHISSFSKMKILNA